LCKDYLHSDRFVVSLNPHRRHLTESQGAAVAAKLAKIGAGLSSGN